MRFWKAGRDALISRRLRDEEIHALALREVESGHRRDGLWAQALIESNGERVRLDGIYLRLLVATLRDEANILASRESKDSESPVNESKPLISVNGSFADYEALIRSKGGHLGSTFGLLGTKYKVRYLGGSVELSTFDDVKAWIRRYVR